MSTVQQIICIMKVLSEHKCDYGPRQKRKETAD